MNLPIEPAGSAPLYELYYSSGTACLAPHIVLEALQLPYRLVETDILKGMHRTKDYLALNPAGRVPALRLPDGTVMTEAAAICLYLADLHPQSKLSPAPDHPDRPEFLRWLMYLATSIQEAYKRYYYPERYVQNPALKASVNAQAIIDLNDRWALVETHLSKNGPYFLGDAPTIVDIFMTMLVTWHQPVDALLSASPAVKRCHDGVRALPAVKTCIEGQGEISACR
ncbi:MAG: glutathione S-transferase [Rhizobiaceae bacterium MnEN-MB40S]|nr:MAG: glutathione S-transferase [Rhizobiaceae bacterium MnEN-MB40S]